MKEQLMHLTSEDVRANMTRIESGADYVDDLTNKLGTTVYGQDEACRVVARRVAIYKAELNHSDRPRAVQMFLGPTGVGKTEMAHALAKLEFNDKNSPQLQIIDCAELSEAHMATRLTGAPPSYVGFGAKPLITEEFLEKENIIVFDEVEKAHPVIHQLLLGVMEDARMTRTASSGQKKMDFTKSHIIMTSNVGAREVDEARTRNEFGFGGLQTESRREHDSKRISRQALEQRFAPEFINRIDDIVVFKELGEEQFNRIYHKFIDEINEDLVKRGENPPYVATTTEFKDFVLGKIDKRYGARDLRRHLDRELLEGLANVFMGMDASGLPIVADREEDKTFFYTTKIEEKPPYELLDNPLLEGEEKPIEPEIIDLEDDVDDFERKQMAERARAKRKKRKKPKQE